MNPWANSCSMKLPLEAKKRLFVEGIWAEWVYLKSPVLHPWVVVTGWQSRKKDLLIKIGDLSHESMRACQGGRRSESVVQMREEKSFFLQASPEGKCVLPSHNLFWDFGALVSAGHILPVIMDAEVECVRVWHSKRCNHLARPQSLLAAPFLHASNLDFLLAC